MICVGTCGYSYKDWIGPFYHEGTKDTQMLEYYAQNFDFVEVNSSFYHMPGLRLFESITKKTGTSFRVAVKLYQGFTHVRDLGDQAAGNFMYSVKPLAEAGKLMCLLAQFPYSFHFNQQNMDYIKRMRSWFGDMPLNVEFRNQAWICEQVMKTLKAEDIGFVCVDEPAVGGLIKNVTAATSSIAYLRLHGRNAEKWYDGNGSERYDYKYSMEELIQWVPRIKSLDSDSMTTVIAFNNHPKGKAIENARMMLELLKN
jgi:uncharacterized protein YecE (DUF72 family)